MKARNEFEAARNGLMTYCENATDYICEVKEDTYPLKVVITKDPQKSMFEDEAEDGNLTIEVGLDTKVTSTLNFKMDSALLKKFIKSAEKLAFLYYHAFREEAGEITEEVEDGD